MNRANLVRARVRRGAESVGYLSVLSGLLALSGYAMLGGVGVLLMLVLTTAALVLSNRLPTHVIMRMRGARPLHAHEADALLMMVARLSQAAGLASPPALYLVPARELQAFAVTSGRQAAIGISPGLVRELTLDEIEAVVAHEISHIAYGDTRVMAAAAAMRSLTRSLASLAWMLLLLSILVPSAVVVSLGAALMFVAAPMLSYLAELGLSRTREFHADLAAAELTGRPESLARALFKLERHQTGLLGRLLGRGAVLRLPEGLRTHPATGERIRRLLALSETPPRTRRAWGPRRLAEPHLREAPPPVIWGASRNRRPHQPLRNTRWSVTMI